MRRLNIPQIVLWLWILSVTILMGGGLFEHLVLTPLWAGSPPESVTQWPHGVIQGRFFGIVSPLCFLLSLALIIVSWWMPPRQRKWALVAGLTLIIMGISTFAFFLPILRKTLGMRGAGLTGEEITTLGISHDMELGALEMGIGAWMQVARVSSPREASLDSDDDAKKRKLARINPSLCRGAGTNGDIARCTARDQQDFVGAFNINSRGMNRMSYGIKRKQSIATRAKHG